MPGAMLAAALAAAPALGQGLEEPLTAVPGDPVAGAAIVGEPTRGLCLLCHAGPFPDVPFQGTLAPPLDGVGARLSVPELRLRIVDSRQVNSASIMPPYHSLVGLTRVGERWQGDTILSAQEVEDVVAFLATLTDPPIPEETE
ncbi:sulfur oxidation c-type cytochrome SoxX [Pseudoroseicyclus tamaricis]|uniref:sulfur oxidation c-type cytochrome SoxX n=1 Tax=Pseudoroseicyclus tamaricis TaxID=2705421 RepID=UPI001F1CD273|nr:sulfur oxidation c-type cytochrome SoxX [Pseudoroseicyclus tamaricis]